MLSFRSIAITGRVTTIAAKMLNLTRFSLFTKLAYKLEPKRIKFVHPFVDKEANMVLIEALKGGNSRITVEKPLIVYKEPGIYTEDIKKIYGIILNLLFTTMKV